MAGSSVWTTGVEFERIWCQMRTLLRYFLVCLWVRFCGKYGSSLFFSRYRRFVWYLHRRRASRKPKGGLAASLPVSESSPGGIGTLSQSAANVGARRRSRGRWHRGSNSGKLLHCLPKYIFVMDLFSLIQWVVYEAGGRDQLKVAAFAVFVFPCNFNKCYELDP